MPTHTCPDCGQQYATPEGLTPVNCPYCPQQPIENDKLELTRSPFKIIDIWESNHNLNFLMADITYAFYLLGAWASLLALLTGQDTIATVGAICFSGFIVACGIYHLRRKLHQIYVQLCIQNGFYQVEKYKLKKTK